MASREISGFVEWHSSTGTVQLSREVAALLGLPPGIALALRTAFKQIARPERAALIAAIRTAIAARDPLSHESRLAAILRPAGSNPEPVTLHLDARLHFTPHVTPARPSTPPPNTPTRALGAISQISDSNCAARHISAPQTDLASPLHTLIRTAPVGIALLDESLRYQYVNDYLADINGLSPEAHLGRTVKEIVPLVVDDIASVLDSVLDSVLRLGAPAENVLVSGQTAKLPGVDRVWNTSWFPVQAGPDGARGVGIVVHEVTKQREFQLALRRSEARFRALTQAMPQLVWSCDPDINCTFASAQWLEATGQSDRDALGQGWLNAMHPEDLARVRRAWEVAAQSRQAFEADLRLKMSDGRYRWFLSRAQAVISGEDKIEYWIGTSTDIEHRKQAEGVLARDNEALEQIVADRTEELRRFHQQQRFSERMALMGTLAAGLGHDLSNFLVPLKIRLDLLAADALSPDSMESVTAIRASLRYAQRLAEGLRLLAQDPAGVRPGETTKVGEWWAHAEPLLSAVLPAGAALRSTIRDPDCEAAISNAALMQIAFNLVRNSGEATRGRRDGWVEITIWCADDQLFIKIADNGRGMSEEVLARCQDPFFTTKARSEATGLGLAVVYSCVNQVAGRVEIRSEVDRGTEITVRLALAPKQFVSAGVALVRVADQRLRSYVAAELRALGCEVTELIDDARAHDVQVVDRVRDATQGCDVVVIGEGPAVGTPANVYAIGPSPTHRAIRDVLKMVRGQT